MSLKDKDSSILNSPQKVAENFSNIENCYSSSLARPPYEKDFYTVSLEHNCHTPAPAPFTLNVNSFVCSQNFNQNKTSYPAPTLSQNVETEKKSCGRRYVGILLAILASVFLSLTTLVAKLLIGYHPLNVAVWRFQGVLLPSLPLLVYSSFVQNEPVFKSIFPVLEIDKLKTSLLLFLRAFFGCTAVIMQFYALQYIAIGDAMVISFTTPVFVGVLSYFILGEKFSIVQIIAALLTVLGVGIITRPPILSGSAEFDANNLIGAGLALGCMFFASFTYVILRLERMRNVHYSLVTFFYGFYSIIECSICASALGVLQIPQNGQDWLLAGALAGLAFAGQSCFTQALKFEDAGPVSLIRTSEVIFTFLWQILFFKQLPDIFSIIGTLTIVVAVILITVRKWIFELPEKNELKATFSFCLK